LLLQVHGIDEPQLRFKYGSWFVERYSIDKRKCAGIGSTATVYCGMIQQQRAAFKVMNITRTIPVRCRPALRLRLRQRTQFAIRLLPVVSGQSLVSVESATRTTGACGVTGTVTVYCGMIQQQRAAFKVMNITRTIPVRCRPALQS
jgi:hypothetical protein